MKLVTWNCNGGLRKKTEQLDSLDADVYVIQECENPALSTSAFKAWAGDYLWVGTSKHKGLGVFPKKGNRVRAEGWTGTFKLPEATNQSTAWAWATEDLKLFLPFTLNEQFTVLGAWTKANGADAFQYMGQLWKYLQIHKHRLLGGRTVVLGDFNSNRIWDEPDRWWNHSNVMDELAAIGLQSVYHAQTGAAQGEETTPTFYQYRNPQKGYHIDYAVVSADLLPHSNLSIGAPSDWLTASDHMPLVLELGE